MSDLGFKLEYFKADTASDEAVYIQLRSDLVGYMSLIGKEDYSKLADGKKTAIMTAIFACLGVTQASAQAYRVYIEKSPVFSWTEVLGPVVEAIRVATGNDTITELPGSPTYLTSDAGRRSP